MSKNLKKLITYEYISDWEGLYIGFFFHGNKIGSIFYDMGGFNELIYDVSYIESFIKYLGGEVTKTTFQEWAEIVMEKEYLWDPEVDNMDKSKEGVGRLE
jgi:hypothetical protein